MERVKNATENFGGIQRVKLITTMVRATGLEPAHLTAQDPKSCVSANSTMPA